MDILSAESYTESVAASRNVRRSPDADELWGGLLVESSPDRTPGPRQKKQKTRRPSGKDEMAGPHQRGRPRLDTGDKTAGERRRTQIRLAQRAYRQRKETTISELNEQVADLERIIGAMDRRLSSFHKRALASGLKESSPLLAQELRAIAASFSDIACDRASANKPDRPSPGSDLSARVYDLGDPVEGNESVKNIAARNRVDMYSINAKPIFESSRVWGYDVDKRDTQRDANNYGPMDNSTNLDVTTQNTADLYHDDIPDLYSEAQSMVSFPSKPLASPSTYSFQESTFARRLARSAYERAYRVLTDPSSRKEDIYAMCRFTFCFTKAQNILNFITSITAKAKDESLEMWQAPQLHLGDAGLHYPRQIENHVPSYWADKAPMGPRRSAMAETPVPDFLTVDQIIEITGFQGEWFDAHDVEHYLKAKGLRLDAQSTWLELDMDEVPALEHTHLPTSGSPAESCPNIDPSSPTNIESCNPDEPAVHAAEIFWDDRTADLQDDLYLDLNPQLGDNPNKGSGVSNLSYGAKPFFSDTFPIGITSAKKMVNVEKFIDIVVNHGVCLGRTPGWRRSTIDTALASSIQEVF